MRVFECIYWRCAVLCWVCVLKDCRWVGSCWYFTCTLSQACLCDFTLLPWVAQDVSGSAVCVASRVRGKEYGSILTIRPSTVQRKGLSGRCAQYLETSAGVIWRARIWQSNMQSLAAWLLLSSETSRKCCWVLVGRTRVITCNYCRQFESVFCLFGAHKLMLLSRRKTAWMEIINCELRQG